MDADGCVMDTGWGIDPAGWAMDTVEDLEDTVPWDTALSPAILVGNSAVLRPE